MTTLSIYLSIYLDQFKLEIDIVRPDRLTSGLEKHHQVMAQHKLARI